MLRGSTAQSSSNTAPCIVNARRLRYFCRCYGMFCLENIIQRQDHGNFLASAPCRVSVQDSLEQLRMQRRLTLPTLEGITRAQIRLVARLTSSSDSSVRPGVPAGQKHDRIHNLVFPAKCLCTFAPKIALKHHQSARTLQSPCIILQERSRQTCCTTSTHHTTHLDVVKPQDAGNLPAIPCSQNIDPPRWSFCCAHQHHPRVAAVVAAIRWVHRRPRSLQQCSAAVNSPRNRISHQRVSTTLGSGRREGARIGATYCYAKALAWPLHLTFEYVPIVS